MASAIKKLNKISQIVRLKQVMKRWKNTSLKRQSIISYDDDDYLDSIAGFSFYLTHPLWLSRRLSRRRMMTFRYPPPFMNLSVFVSLLNKAEEILSRSLLRMTPKLEIFSKKLMDRE
uniref:Uncharacterized protein n=1 Tax=Davidia involucrata TaxID=16924 RepID=A0A5B7BYM7_DAVIN